MLQSVCNTYHVAVYRQLCTEASHVSDYITTCSVHGGVASLRTTIKETPPVHIRSCICIHPYEYIAHMDLL